jgi:hypothetical protein
MVMIALRKRGQRQKEKVAFLFLVNKIKNTGFLSLALRATEGNRASAQKLICKSNASCP